MTLALLEGLGAVGLGAVVGVWWERRRSRGPDRTYRVVVVDETPGRERREDSGP